MKRCARGSFDAPPAGARIIARNADKRSPGCAGRSGDTIDAVKDAATPRRYQPDEASERNSSAFGQAVSRAMPRGSSASSRRCPRMSMAVATAAATDTAAPIHRASWRPST
jgi:hypothetical protein